MVELLLLLVGHDVRASSAKKTTKCTKATNVGRSPAEITGGNAKSLGNFLH